jgi:hypothetical protein
VGEGDCAWIAPKPASKGKANAASIPVSRKTRTAMRNEPDFIRTPLCLFQKARVTLFPVYSSLFACCEATDVWATFIERMIDDCGERALFQGLVYD